MEEEEGVGLAVAKATELRLKICNCIQKGTASKPASPNKLNPRQQQQKDDEQTDKKGSFNGDKIPNSHQSVTEAVEEEDDDDDEEEETEKLFNIRDSLESLEAQLVELQNLQHQQRYEKEIALSEIDNSRRILLEKLEGYQGKNLEVILEASAFVSKTVENNGDLLLPPYPSLPPRSLVLDNGYFSYLQLAYKSLPNDVTNGDQTDGAKKLNEHEQNKNQDQSKNSRKGLGYFFSSAVKTVLPIVGVIYILSLSNFVPNLGKGTPLKSLGMLQQQRTTEEKNSRDQCPPGKVLVMDRGEARCLVKERIEVPFESIAAKPDVNYGCG